MSGEEDWEKWADDEPKPEPQVQQEEKKSKDVAQQEKSKANDMLNVFDLFQNEDALKDKKMRSDDFKKIGENFAIKINASSVTPVQAKDFVKSLLATLDKKLGLKEWEELYQVVDSVYLQKRKRLEEEEAKRKKNQPKAGPPKGISWGKTKGQMDLNDDDAFADDDDFM